VASGFVASKQGRGGLWSRIQSKHFELPRPFRRGVAQPLDVDASGQPALDSSADKLGSKKGEQNSRVHMTNAASLA
jgi:hypothetical protein